MMLVIWTEIVSLRNQGGENEEKKTFEQNDKKWQNHMNINLFLFKVSTLCRSIKLSQENY